MLKIKINKHTFSLFLLVISTFFISQSYNTATSFAQTESGSASGETQSSTESILVCEFVQFCSNPVESSRNDNETSVISPVTAESEAQTTAESEAQTTAESEAQTTPDSSDVLPDVTSNISLIMTPDLPGSVAEEDSQNPINQDLSGANETLQISLNATDNNQMVVPENATVITPDAPIPFETTGENISMTIQNNNDTITTGNKSNNQSEFVNTIPLNNLTMSIDDSNKSQDSPLEVTIDSLGANETIDSLGANETIDSLGANETIDSLGANETIDSLGANETIDSLGANETIDSLGANETIDSLGANETIDSLGANETIILDTPVQNENQSTASNEITSSATPNEGQQDNTSNANDIQSSSSPSTENQTTPTSFLDPIINPFKELFGLK
ncbi:DUF4573 domain-containing protein [Candidatus Nitrosocosmicus arcticus]|uniref:Uncharacterized protein n=1 Tax=Candidatus Nitrosocosmicus arcticus TaxID=2035267 RepID=A0A557SX86_9ARCH|nr:DUF4573 domain-containing protein [Candidatus Nitrosocosmicus arcticus]TVP41201.1 exported protein of unknown function [Candidatus Nitrosocosmicus arcticus]